MPLSKGDFVLIRVPGGQQYAGVVTATGTVEASKTSRIDGRTYLIRESSGELVEHSESWLEPYDGPFPN